MSKPPEPEDVYLWVVFVAHREEVPRLLGSSPDMEAAYFLCLSASKIEGYHALVFAADPNGSPLFWAEPSKGEEFYLPEPGDWIEKTPGLLPRLAKAVAIHKQEEGRKHSPPVGDSK